jgi:hypothetical protein
MIAPKILFILQTPFSLPFESTIDSSSVRQDGDESAIGQAISARPILLLLILIDLTLILSAPVLIIALVVASIVVSVVVLAIIPTIVPTIVVPVVIAAIITLIIPTLIIAVVATIISPVIATIVARLCLVDYPTIPRPVFGDLRRACDRKAEHERAHCQHDT